MDGNFGGEAYEFIYKTSVTEQDPEPEKIQLSNTYFPNADYIYIDSNSNDTVSKIIDEFMESVRLNESNTKGFVKLIDKTDEKYILYQISKATNNTGWWKLDVTLQSQSSILPTFDDDEQIKVNVIMNGSRGG